MSAAFQQILQLLRSVEPEERYKLQILLGSKNGTANFKKQKHEDWLLDGIQRELRRRGMRYQPITLELIRRLAPRCLDEAQLLQQTLRAQLLRELKHFGSGPSVKHVQLLALGLELARVLADYLQQIAPKAPLGLQRMLVNVAKVPEAVENSYPGYLSCGMLHCLVGEQR